MLTKEEITEALEERDLRHREALNDMREADQKFWSARGRDQAILSILSDAQEELDLGRTERANDKINFAKYIVVNG